MKRVLSILVILSLIFTFTACAENDREFELGTTKGLIYENKFIGIGCELKSDWYFYTDEQIRELNNFSMNVAGDEFKELAENADVFYDMFASASDNQSNINVNLEKVSNIKLATLDIEENYEAIYPTVETSLRNMGYSNFKHSVGSVTISDKDFPTMFISAKFSTFDMYQALINIKCNGYLASVTITATSEDAVNSLVDCFYLLD